jgi:hypothetical protein
MLPFAEVSPGGAGQGPGAALNFPIGDDPGITPFPDPAAVRGVIPYYLRIAHNTLGLKNYAEKVKIKIYSTFGLSERIEKRSFLRGGIVGGGPSLPLLYNLPVLTVSPVMGSSCSVSKSRNMVRLSGIDKVCVVVMIGLPKEWTSCI